MMTAGRRAKIGRREDKRDFFFLISWEEINLSISELVKKCTGIKPKPSFCMTHADNQGLLFFHWMRSFHKALEYFQVRGRSSRWYKPVGWLSAAKLQKVWPSRQNSDAFIIRENELPRPLNPCSSDPVDNIVRPCNSTVMIFSFES